MIALDYVLSLKDNEFNKQIERVKNKTKGFDEFIKGTISSISNLGFEMPGLGQMVSDGIVAFDAYKKANASLREALEATNNTANQTIGGLTTQADKLQHTTLFSAVQTQEAQALLLTFTNVKNKIFTDAIPAIQDLATKMSGSGATDLKGATAQIGAALNNPIKGIQSLKTAGINFNDTQIATIGHLVNTGKTAEAQRIILDGLGKEFGGSAAAARKAIGGYADYQENMGSLELTIGSIGTSLRDSLAPAFAAAAGFVNTMIAPLKGVADWMSKNADMVTGLTIAIGIMSTYFLLANGYIALNAWYMGLSSTAIIFNTLITEGLSAAWMALNMVMTANPIGVVIAAIAVLSGVFYVIYQRSASFRAILAGIGEVASSLVPIFMGLGKVMLGVMTSNPLLIADGFKQSVDGVKKIMDGGGISGMFKKGYNKSLEESAKQEKADKAKEAAEQGKRLLPAATVPATNKPATAPAFRNMEAAGKAAKPANALAKNESVGAASGGRNISVIIQKLIGIENMNTTNIKESFADAGNLVREALIKSIRDAEIAVSGE